MQFRDGLIIALLAARPLRLRNLTGLELERTMARRGDVWWINIPADETKTRAPIEVPWPEALTAALTTYLDIPTDPVPAAQPLDTSGRHGIEGLHARLADVSNGGLSVRLGIA